MSFRTTVRNLIQLSKLYAKHVRFKISPRSSFEMTIPWVYNFPVLEGSVFEIYLKFTD